MKLKLIVAIVLALIVAVLIATPALAQGGGGDFCSPWTWAWFRTGNGLWWYFQWFHDCWNPQSGWYRVWGSWGWA